MSTETLTRPETRPATLEPTTPIRPSEALRLGRLVRPVEAEPFETLFGEPNRACALGAMAVGYGFDPSHGEPTLAYNLVAGRTGWSFDDLPDDSLKAVWSRFDEARMDGRSGDAAVLAYLEARGL